MKDLDRRVLHLSETFLWIQLWVAGNWSGIVPLLQPQLFAAPVFKLKHPMSMDFSLNQGLLTGLVTKMLLLQSRECWAALLGAALPGAPAGSACRILAGWEDGLGRAVLLDHCRLCDSKCHITTAWAHTSGVMRGNFFQVLPRHTRAVHSLAWKRTTGLLFFAGLHFLQPYCTSRKNTPEEINQIKTQIRCLLSVCPFTPR